MAPALTAAFGPPELKLEKLAGADGARHRWALSGNIITALTMPALAWITQQRSEQLYV